MSVLMSFPEQRKVVLLGTLSKCQAWVSNQWGFRESSPQGDGDGEDLSFI